MGSRAKGTKAGINLPPPYARAVKEDMARWRLSRSAVIQRALRAYYPMLAIDEPMPEPEQLMAAPCMMVEKATIPREMTSNKILATGSACPWVTEDATISSEMSATADARISASTPKSTGQDRTATQLRVKVVPSVGSSMRVRAVPAATLPVGSTTTSGPHSAERITADPVSRGPERESPRETTLAWMFKAHQDPNETQHPGMSPGAFSLTTPRRRKNWSIRRRNPFRRGSVIRVRRRDGSAYLARVC